jgi:hypothetical protein
MRPHMEERSFEQPRRIGKAEPSDPRATGSLPCHSRNPMRCRRPPRLFRGG